MNEEIQQEQPIETEVSQSLQRNLSSQELQAALANVMSIPEDDRGALAMEMVNITNATNRILNERNQFKEKTTHLEETLRKANERIGALYGQLSISETTGESKTQQTRTTKTLMDLGRKA